MFKNRKGFTLIELLIIIAIIGLLAVAVTVIFISVQKEARDSKRLADIKQIQESLDQYYAQNGHYPISGNCSTTIPNAGWCNSVQALDSGRWILDDGEVSLQGIMTTDPIDPQQGDVIGGNWLSGQDSAYYYYSRGYGGAGQWYMMVVKLEDDSHEQQELDGVTACNDQYFHYGNGSNGILTVGRNCVE